VSNRRDEVAFKRITKMLPGVGAKTADTLWREWMRSRGAEEKPVLSFSKILLEFKVPAKGKSAWEQMAYTLDELVDAEGNPKPPSPMMPSIMGGVYEEYMRSKFTNFDSRKQDLQQLERYAEKFENIDEFLSQLSLLAGQDTLGATQEDPDADAVCLSSVHQAKGLEWRAVFVVWLADGKFPNSRVIDEDNEDQSGLEEERRLFYVAVTRARDELYLTYPLLWHGAFDGEVLQRPSRFIEDIPTELVEEWNVGAAW